MHKYVARTGRPARIRDLYEALKLEREARGGRKRELPNRWAHLEPAFGHLAASEVTTDDCRRYIVARKAEGAANATVNRELSALRRMFNLARQSTPPRVSSVPYVPRLREANPRSGFIEDADFDKLAGAATEPWLRAFVEVAYTYAWRVGELLPLRLRQLNFTNRTIRLDTGTTKNGDGREVMMTDRVFGLLRAVTEGKGPDAAVFTRRKNGQQKPVRDMRDAWASLLKRAGLSPRLLVHDFRRSGAKHLRRAGVPESVVMRIGGWRTAGVFRRYAIVSSADQRAAVEMLERARTERATANAAGASTFESAEPTAAGGLKPN
jgi:integrase